MSHPRPSEVQALAEMLASDNALIHDLAWSEWDDQAPAGWRWLDLAARLHARGVRVAPSPTPLPIVGMAEDGRYSHVEAHPCGACQSYAFEFGFQSAQEAWLGVAPSPEHTYNGLVPTHARRPGDSAAHGGEALPDRLSGSNRTHPSQPDAPRTWREAARDLHAAGDDEPYVRVAPSPDAPGPRRGWDVAEQALRRIASGTPARRAAVLAREALDALAVAGEAPSPDAPHPGHVPGEWACSQACFDAVTRGDAR